MNARPHETTQDSEESLDKAIRTYQAMGFPESRVVSLVLRSGYPRQAIQSRFPDLDLSALAHQAPAATLVEAGQSVTRDSARSSSSKELVPMAQSGGMRSVLNRLATNEPPRNAEAAMRAPKASTIGSDGLSFQYVPLIQCTFPHADPGEQTLFSRRNGRLELTLSTARPDAGLPYGVPARLLTIYCTSEAKRNKSPRIELGPSIQEFLRRMDVPVTRGDRGSLRLYANQLLRLCYCTICIDEEIEDSNGRPGLDIRPTLFVDRARFWWDPEEGLGPDSFLELSPRIYQSILTRSAPLSTRAIRALRKSPMDLDVYAWLVHRLYKLSAPSTVTWKQLFGQFGHSYGELRYFRRFFCGSLTKALHEYPQARVKINDTGLQLFPSQPHIEPRADLLA